MAKRACVIPGDGAAPEAVLPTLGVLQAMKLDIEFSALPTGEEGRARYGERWADVCREAIDDGDILSAEAAGSSAAWASTGTREASPRASATASARALSGVFLNPSSASWMAFQA